MHEKEVSLAKNSSTLACQAQKKRSRKRIVSSSDEKDKDGNYKSERVPTNDGEVKMLFSYTLPVEPNLFGQLRIRCWCKGEKRPSPFSVAISLPRYMGPAADAKQMSIVEEAASYFSKMKQHATCGQSHSSLEPRTWSRV